MKKFMVSAACMMFAGSMIAMDTATTAVSATTAPVVSEVTASVAPTTAVTTEAIATSAAAATTTETITTPATTALVKPSWKMTARGLVRHVGGPVLSGLVLALAAEETAVKCGFDTTSERVIAGGAGFAVGIGAGVAIDRNAEKIAQLIRRK